MTWVLVTGATAGIGKDAVHRLARAGLRVIATGRDERKLAPLAAEGIATVLLDVTDAASLERAVERVDAITAGHGIDVLINNAGYGEMGPLETFSTDRVRAMFETNVVGLARVTRAFVPAMRRRKSGRVINVSSLLGRTTIPAQGPYAATKHALEALSDALRRELAPFGVSVVVVEPGAVDTGFSDIAYGALDRLANDPEWSDACARIRRLAELNRRGAAPPEAVSRVLLEAATARSPRPRYVVPCTAAAQLALTRAMPRRLYEVAMRRAMGLRPVRRNPGTRAELALVTGAGGSVGRATVLRLAKRGFKVLATDRDEAALARVARYGREARLSIETRPMDVTDEGSIAEVARWVERESGGRGLDVLVNHASHAELGPIELADDRAWREQLAVNVYGLHAVTRAFAPAMRRSGKGRIVNVSSVAGVVAFPFMGVYCASKFAVEALTDVMRLELGAFGVGVSAVQPAFVRSGFAGRALEAVERRALEDGPYGPVAARMEAIFARLDAAFGEPDDVARAIVSAVTDPAPRARYQAPFSAKVAVRAAAWLPESVQDRALARAFETARLAPS